MKTYGKMYYYIFCTCLLFVEAFTENNIFEEFGVSFNSSNTILANETTINDIDMKNITIESITQPMGMDITIDNQPNIDPPFNNSNRSKDKRDFKPSLHLGTFYEFPPTSASPEAKHSVGFGPVEESPWQEHVWSTTELPWTTKIKFPTQKPIILTTNDHPYPFVKEDLSTEKNAGMTTYEFITINNPPRHQYGFSSPGATHHRTEQIESTDKYESGFNEKRHQPFNVQTHTPSILNNLPWNKIAKFLTAAIPIGLLIGALTPTVINVSPINVTQSRGRLDENESKTKMQMIYSSKLVADLQKKGCEQRILCEILLSAGLSKNGEEYAENFLDLFVKEKTNIVEKTSELNKMLDAVKRGNCKEFRCENSKKRHNKN